MNKFIKSSLYLLSLLLILSACRKKEFDAYYGRPETLADPIYQQLQSRKNFTNFLTCIDKSGYKDILSTGGYWTMFAPNDAAFAKYFKDNGISDISALKDSVATAIVKYSLIYNAFKTDHLADFQSATGYVTNSAFKRRTAYYDFVYNEKVNGNNLKVLAANRNGGYISSTSTTSPVTDFNNKYYPYFLSGFMTARSLGAADYNYFYPNTPYNGFNIADGSVVNKDIIAENGVIHEVDRVVAPLPSIDQYLASKPEYSEFKRLFDRYEVSYSPNADATHRYQVLTGKTDQVNIKIYSGTLAFSPNNENYLKISDNDGQSDGYTMFAPNNTALLDYEKKVLLKYYPAGSTTDALPLPVVNDFLNAHLFQTSVWPTRFDKTFNPLGEVARFNPATNIVDKKLLSNGLFYGANQVQAANVFSTVYSKLYLDPKFSLMNQAINSFGLRFNLIVPNIKYTVFMVSDAVLRANGFDYNTINATFQYTPPGGTTVIGGTAVTRLQRIINQHIVPTPLSDLENLSGEGLAETFGGEYIKYKNNRVISAGTTDSAIVAKQSVRIDSTTTANNGRVYYINGLLNYTDFNVGIHIARYAVNPTDPFYNFFQYLKSSPLYNAATGEIQGVSGGVNYTVFIPNNAAIVDAVAKGWLPPITAPTASVDIDKVTRFIQYHILDKNTVVTDGKKSGVFLTLLKNSTGDQTSVILTNQPGNLQITDQLSGTPNASVVIANSNILSTRIVIHQINTFLKYNF